MNFYMNNKQPAPETPERESSPDISILMTAYNAESYLWEALESVSAQRTSRSWELLFVDDGSTDGTRAVAAKFQQWSGAQMQIFEHPGLGNLGISASRNLALSRARAPLLAFLDADDVWLPHHLETQVSLMDAHEEIGMAYAGAERWVHFDRPFNERQARAASWGENYLPPLVPADAAAGLLPRGLLLDWFLADESLVPCICTVMVRTAIARSVGGFCNEFRGLYDDQVFHAKVCAHFDVYANDVCVARYRQHPQSCCAKARDASPVQRAERRRWKRFLLDETLGKEDTRLT
jgi:glycosyltransferase involved in cell wall biosynthesis